MAGAVGFANRAQETTQTQGDTDPYTLDGAPTGKQTLVAAAKLVTGDPTGPWDIEYCCEDGTDYEIGRGSLSEATGGGGEDELTRATVLESTNAGAAVVWGAGTRNIFITPSGQKLHALFGLGAGIPERTGAETWAARPVGATGLSLLAAATAAAARTELGPGATGESLFLAATAAAARALLSPSSIGEAIFIAASVAAARAAFDLIVDDLANIPSAAGSGRRRIFLAQDTGQLFVETDAPDWLELVAADSALFGGLAPSAFMALSGSNYAEHEFAVPTSGTGASTAAHSFGAIPSHHACFFRCNSTDNGYPAGIEVPIGAVLFLSGSFRIHPYVDASNFVLAYDHGGDAVQFLDSSGNVVTISGTKSKWRIVIKAWK